MDWNGVVVLTQYAELGGGGEGDVLEARSGGPAGEGEAVVARLGNQG